MFCYFYLLAEFLNYEKHSLFCFFFREQKKEEKTSGKSRRGRGIPDTRRARSASDAPTSDAEGGSGSEERAGNSPSGFAA